MSDYDNPHEELDAEEWQTEASISLHDIPEPRKVSELSESQLLKQKYDRLTGSLNNLTLEEKRDLKERLITKSVQQARENFYAYALIMAPLMIPEGFVNGRHLKLICDSLQKVEESVYWAHKDIKNKVKEEDQRQSERVQYFMPPRSMKSLLCSRLFVSWCLGRHPEWQFLQFGHGTDFSITNFGRPLKELLLSPEYQVIFPETKLKQDAKRAQEFETTKGGRYYCAGAGSSVAGRGAHIVLCDDVLSEHTAYSKTARSAVNDWYTVGPRQRLFAWGAEVLVNTRWHIDDLSGSRLEADGEFGTETASRSKRPWKVLRFEAILKEEGAKFLGLPIGSSFWPELWPKNRLLEFKNDPKMPPSRWNALYMQSPTPDEGNIIKHEQWQKWTYRNENDEIITPPLDYIVASVDSAFSVKESADYSAYTVWGIYKKKEVGYDGKEYIANHALLLYSEKDRWEFPELCNKMKEIDTEYKPDLFIVEKKASGQSLIQEMRRRSLPVFEYVPDKDKLTRMHAASPFFTQGAIWAPETDWAKQVIEEVCGFPYAPNDDLSDTVSQFVLWVRDSFQLDSVDYPRDWEDEEDEDNDWNNPAQRSYWDSVMTTRH